MFHRKLFRRLPALICALALCLGLSGPASAAGDVYFSVVNDSMITLSDSTMPVWSGGVLYAPHSVFDGTNSTGIGFGLNFSYNRDTGIASLFTTQQILTFDLNRGISYDYISGTPLKGRAILQNGRSLSASRAGVQLFRPVLFCHLDPGGAYCAGQKQCRQSL